MPPEEEKLDFQKIMEIGAESLGGAVASEIVAQMFGGRNNTEAIITRAVEEICTRLTKIIDNAFMEHYISITNSLASRLLTYQETNDLNLLDEIIADASDNYHNLKRFDTIESITSCNYVCTLHLVAAKASAEHNPGYSETIKRLGKEYAAWSQSTAHRLNDLTNASVDEPFVPGLDRPSSGYTIKEFHLSSQNQLIFHTSYRDHWSYPDLKYVQSDPIPIPKEFCIKESTLEIFLTNEAKNDPKIKDALKNFYEKSKQSKMEFLGSRLDVSNAMVNSIHYACNSWNNLS
ncbi:hypothetical protein [Bacillus atrophaeus]|uniref:hypothetical protein n=1 Tax=Bacillus atrophaeus TaxID=1452 RepID=UPI000D028142|nr:hypothetical protein [Bacillus atrophaeus]PRR87410.1 hypothetical protein C6W23_18900 [Bacillus atrophaeus]